MNTILSGKAICLSSCLSAALEPAAWINTPISCCRFFHTIIAHFSNTTSWGTPCWIWLPLSGSTTYFPGQSSVLLQCWLSVVVLIGNYPKQKWLCLCYRGCWELSGVSGKHETGWYPLKLHLDWLASFPQTSWSIYRHCWWLLFPLYYWAGKLCLIFQFLQLKELKKIMSVKQYLSIVIIQLQKGKRCHSNISTPVQLGAELLYHVKKAKMPQKIF